MSGRCEQAAQCRIVDLRHDVIVEHRLPGSVKYLVGDNTAKKLTHPTLETKIGAFQFRRQAEKKFPEIDIGERTPDGNPAHCGACLVDLHADGRPCCSS